MPCPNSTGAPELRFMLAANVDPRTMTPINALNPNNRDNKFPLFDRLLGEAFSLKLRMGTRIE
jgi:hypothetical protein